MRRHLAASARLTRGWFAPAPAERLAALRIAVGHAGVIFAMNVWFPYPLCGVAFLPLIAAERVVGAPGALVALPCDLGSLMPVGRSASRRGLPRGAAPPYPLGAQLRL